MIWRAPAVLIGSGSNAGGSRKTSITPSRFTTWCFVFSLSRTPLTASRIQHRGTRGITWKEELGMAKQPLSAVLGEEEDE